MLPTRKVSSTSKTKFNMAHESMLGTVMTSLLSTGNLAITQSVPDFYQLWLFIQSNLNTIDTLCFVVDMPITGFAVQKKMAKGVLITLSVQVMYSTYSYAIANNLPQLAAQMLTSKSALRNKGYRGLLQYVGGAIQIVSPLATAGTLNGVNVTPAVVSAWQGLWNQLNLIMSDPQAAIANRVSLNKNIYDLLHECMFKLTNNSDTLVYQFETGNLNYFNAYWSLRKLRNHPVHTQLRAWVQSEVDQPIVATVSISGTTVSGQTDPTTGYVHLSGFPFGEHEVVVTVGTTSKTYGPFDFKKGQSLTKHFVAAPDYAEPAKIITENTTETTVEK